MADPDFELRWGPGFGLLALPAFLPSVISSFFTQKRGVGGLGPSHRSTTDKFEVRKKLFSSVFVSFSCFYFQFYVSVL